MSPVGPPSVDPPTRAELRQDVLNIMDAYGSPRWDASMQGEIDRRCGSVHRREWRRILNAAPYANVTMLTPTTDANGNIPISTFTSGSGDALQYFYRVVSLFVNNYRYEFVDSRNWVQAQLLPIQDFVWFWVGSNVVVPNVPNTTLTGLWVNWVPQRFDLLASDQSVVVLPEDYDDIFSHEAAARLLMKGGAETGASAELKAIASEIRDERLADLMRLSVDPTKVQEEDSVLDWGNQ